MDSIVFYITQIIDLQEKLIVILSEQKMLQLINFNFAFLLKMHSDVQLKNTYCYVFTFVISFLIACYEQFHIKIIFTIVCVSIKLIFWMFLCFLSGKFWCPH